MWILWYGPRQELLIRERLTAGHRSRNDSQWPNDAIPAAMMAPAGLPLEGARQLYHTLRMPQMTKMPLCFSYSYIFMTVHFFCLFGQMCLFGSTGDFTTFFFVLLLSFVETSPKKELGTGDFTRPRGDFTRPKGDFTRPLFHGSLASGIFVAQQAIFFEKGKFLSNRQKSAPFRSF